MTAPTLPRNVFDADSHVIEPPDALRSLLPARLAPRGPTLVERDGSEWITCDDTPLFSIGRLAGLARREQQLRTRVDELQGRWEADILPGAYDVEARLDDMRRDGVEAAILFPTVAMTFYGLDDRDLIGGLLRAYNDWLARHCDQHRDTLVPVCMLDPVDIHAAVAELSRCRELGHRMALVPLWEDGSEPYWSVDFDPLYSAAEDMDMPIGFHAFAGRNRTSPPGDSQSALIDAVVDRPAEVQRVIARLIFSGVFDRHPRLRWFSAENDAGWASWFLFRADEAYRRSPDSFGCSRAPSAVFGDHVFLTFMRDSAAVIARRAIGVDNIMWGSDYPHNVSTWPNSQEVLRRLFALGHVDQAEADSIASDNARRLVGLP